MAGPQRTVSQRRTIAEMERAINNTAQVVSKHDAQLIQHRKDIEGLATAGEDSEKELKEAIQTRADALAQHIKWDEETHTAILGSVTRLDEVGLTKIAEEEARRIASMYSATGIMDGLAKSIEQLRWALVLVAVLLFILLSFMIGDLL